MISYGCTCSEKQVIGVSATDLAEANIGLSKVHIQLNLRPILTRVAPDVSLLKLTVDSSNTCYRASSHILSAFRSPCLEQMASDGSI